MVKNYKQYNESLRDLMVGPTKEEVWLPLINGKLKGLITSIPESPEDFFNQMKDGCVEMNEGRLIILGKNGVKLFWQDSKRGYLWISDMYIWSIFEKIYGLKYNEIQLIIKGLMLDNKEWGGLIPSKNRTYF